MRSSRAEFSDRAHVAAPSLHATTGDFGSGGFGTSDTTLNPSRHRTPSVSGARPHRPTLRQPLISLGALSEAVSLSPPPHRLSDVFRRGGLKAARAGHNPDQVYRPPDRESHVPRRREHRRQPSVRRCRDRLRADAGRPKRGARHAICPLPIGVAYSRSQLLCRSSTRSHSIIWTWICGSRRRGGALPASPKSTGCAAA